ncbi:MAG: hypothetical protein AAFU78_02780, partial [Cyanobacteria bacterium J06633_2]
TTESTSRNVNPAVGDRLTPLPLHHGLVRLMDRSLNCLKAPISFTPSSDYVRSRNSQINLPE